MLTDVYTRHAALPYEWKATRTDVEPARQTNWWRFLQKVITLKGGWSEKMRRKVRREAGTKKEQLQRFGMEVAPTAVKFHELTYDTGHYQLQFWVSEGASGALGFTLDPT